MWEKKFKFWKTHEKLIALFQILSILFLIVGTIFLVILFINIDPNELSTNGIIWDFIYNWIPIFMVSVLIYMVSAIIDLHYM